MSSKTLGFLLVLLALYGCGVNRYVVAPYDQITLEASRQVNPDPAGRASPVRVMVLELTDRATFDNLDFDAVYGHAEVLLGEDLLSFKTRILQPGERFDYRLDLQPRSRYVAVVAAYRDIDRAAWRYVYEVNPDWYHRHQISIGKQQVRLAEKNTAEQAQAAQEAGEALQQELTDQALSEAGDKLSQTVQ